MKISVIIPTRNEADNIGKLLDWLGEHPERDRLEVLVVDAESEDETCHIVETKKGGLISSSRKGRAIQMNLGAKHTNGEVLYFVHADALPPETFVADIQAALEAGYSIGCYRFRFDSTRLLLRINSYMTRFDRIWCRGGDQTLFITRALFDELNGYREEMLIMEDYDIIIRARKKNTFRIIPKDVLVSARKYDKNSYLKVQIANLIIFSMFALNYSQEVMMKTYKYLLR